MIGAMPGPLVSLAEARSRVGAVARPLGSEAVPVAEALGRVLAEEVRAGGDVPAFANSAMDGYAVRADGTARARLVGESRAGAPAARALEAGQAVRISTGAALPEGADAVVPVEVAREEGEEVVFDRPPRPGDHVRRPGEDVREGAVVLERGARIGPGELGALVVAGRGEVSCARRPRVAVLATGDELVAPGAPLGPGQVHDANLVTVAAQARTAGADVSARGPVPDEPGRIEEALAAAVEAADVLVVTGGVSVGRHDHVKDALDRLGFARAFWGVALKPGKPTWAGTRADRLAFGLPGNPVSAMVTCRLFVVPALLALQGAAPPPRRVARLGAAVRRSPDREQAVRVRLEEGEAGPVAHPTGPQGSHVLTSMLGADGLALVAPGAGELAAGGRVEVEPL